MYDQLAAKPFKRVALMACRDKPAIISTLIAIKHQLQTQLAQPLDDIMLEAHTAETLLTPKECDVPIIPSAKLAEHADLLIIVGGDGSLLQAAWIASQQDLPVLGINRGRLGFLTDIHPERFDSIEKVLAGEYREEKRFLLEAQAEHHDQGPLAPQQIALNDVVLSRGEMTRLTEFDIYIDGQFVCHQHADGLIMATPTGSTAYALSGGGPILHPSLEAIALVPMFPHTLSSRSIVIKSSSVVEVFVSEHSSSALGVSCDGQQRIALPIGSKVTVRKQEALLRLIHPINYTYFDTLREKLHWERKQYAHPHSDKKLRPHQGD